jgi:hypothetical protein
MAREVAEAGARFTTIHPKFLADVAAELIKRNCRPEDRVHLMASLARGRLGRPGKLHRVEGTRLSRRPVRQWRQAAPDLVLEVRAMVCTRLSNVTYCKLHDLRPGIASLRHCGVATMGGGDQGGGQVCLPPQLRQGIGTRPGSTSPGTDNEPSLSAAIRSSSPQIGLTPSHWRRARSGSRTRRPCSAGCESSLLERRGDQPGGRRCVSLCCLGLRSRQCLPLAA